jgi:hypothetical protein
MEMKKFLISLNILFVVMFFMAIPAYSVCQGDFNCDDNIDGSDLAKFALNFGANGCAIGCDTGELHGTVSLCDSISGAVGVIDDTMGIAVHTPGMNFFLKLDNSGIFTMLTYQ